MDDNGLSYARDENISFKEFSEEEMRGFYKHLYGSEERGNKYYDEQQKLKENATKVGVSSFRQAYKSTSYLLSIAQACIWRSRRSSPPHYRHFVHAYLGQGLRGGGNLLLRLRQF
jgi:hypothetical protein